MMAQAVGQLNSQTGLLSYAGLLPLAFFLLMVWIAWDMRSILKASQRKNQLSIEGRWQELERYFERCSRTYRPFVWFHRKYLLPGNAEVQHALFLFTQGRLEDALVKVGRGLEQLEGKPQIFRSIYRAQTFKTLVGAHRTRILILTGLGQYDEARKEGGRLEQLLGSSGRPNPALALLEYYCGHLDQALSAAQTVPPQDSQYDSMRGLVALVYCTKGAFDEALQALCFEPADVAKFYSPAGLETVRGSAEGAKLIELQRKKLAGVFQPSRLLVLAEVCLAKEDLEQAQATLDQAEKCLGPQPGIQSSYCRLRACSFAAQGKGAEAEDYIQRLRSMTKQFPRRSLLWEARLAIGRSCFYLKRFPEAVAELLEAQRSALHPIEKHVTAFWLARTHEAAGDQMEAVRFYQMVVADLIPSRARQQAIEALARAGLAQ